MLATAVRIETRFKTDIGTLVSRNDRLCSVTKELRRATRSFLQCRDRIHDIAVRDIDMQLLETIRRAP